jgi:hypothetical protein
MLSGKGAPAEDPRPRRRDSYFRKIARMGAPKDFLFFRKIAMISWLFSLIITIEKVRHLVSTGAVMRK